MLQRRPFLQMAGVLLLPLGSATSHALTPRTLQFPRDFGSHPELRTEWWYLTGHARAGERVFGFQVTFFRSRVNAPRPCNRPLPPNNSSLRMRP